MNRQLKIKLNFIDVGNRTCLALARLMTPKSDVFSPAQVVAY